MSRRARLQSLDILISVAKAAAEARPLGATAYQIQAHSCYEREAVRSCLNEFVKLGWLTREQEDDGELTPGPNPWRYRLGPEFRRFVLLAAPGMGLSLKANLPV